MNQIEQKLSINSHLPIECCDEMAPLTTRRLIGNLQRNQEAARRAEILALRIGRYSASGMNTDRNVNELEALVTSMQENKAMRDGSEDKVLNLITASINKDRYTLGGL